MAKGFFITGSDTGVGKTWIGCQLVNQLRHLKHRVKVRKPVESGCELVNGEYFPSDGHALYEASGQTESLQIITPFRFHAALAPDHAARIENQVIKLEQLVQACLHQVGQDDWLVVEGAGGFYSPICANGLNSDLARHLALDVIIVAPDRLGGINQALLTWQAVQREGLSVHAIILNQTGAEPDEQLDNIGALRQHCSAPVYACAYGGVLTESVF